VRSLNIRVKKKRSKVKSDQERASGALLSPQPHGRGAEGAIKNAKPPNYFCLLIFALCHLTFPA
jgi:hypothetical protein